MHTCIHTHTNMYTRTHTQTHTYTHSQRAEVFEKNKGLTDHGGNEQYTSFILSLRFLYTGSFVAQALGFVKGRILEAKVPIPQVTVELGSPAWNS